MARKMKQEITTNEGRRTLIKGAAFGAAALGLTMAGCASPDAPAASGRGPETKEYDFVIVGAGMGGACAALAASEAGLNYVVLEKAEERNFGGDMSMSGGVINFQPPDRLYELLMDYSGGKADRVITRTMADNCKKSVEWLMDHGISLEDRGVTVGHPGNGPGLAEELRDLLNEKGAEIHYKTKAANLILDEAENRVTGVLAINEDGKRVAYKAAKGVLLASGSYLANEEMMLRYAGSRDIIARGYSHNTGDGHRMAMEARAQMLNMADMHGSPIDPESRAPFLGWYLHGIVVNQECERFVDEMNPPTNYVVMGKAITRQPGGIAYAILDDKWRDLVGEWFQNYYLNQFNGTLLEADTIPELAEKLGLDPDRLVQAVEEYNNAVDEENNTAMTLSPPKTGEARRLINPPFVATSLVNGSALSFGGARVNGNAQVLDLEGQPIPGLYAAGRTVGGLFYDEYVGDEAHGSACGDAMVFGRIAAQSAAAE